MKIEARHIVAGVLLFFAWRGGELGVKWPQLPLPTAAVAVPVAKPTADQLAWATELKAILPKMLVGDREYLSAFYDATKFVLTQDGERSTPIIGDTDKFTVFHAGSLQLAIQKKNVGKYPGLDKAIDAVFLAAAGADVKALDKDTRDKLIAACNVLTYAFKVGTDG
jgi:hypothetical protein